MTEKLSHAPSLPVAPPQDCGYPNNCGWGKRGNGCCNLLCKHISTEALRDAAFFLRQPKEKA